MSSDERNDAERPEEPPRTRACIMCGPIRNSTAELLYQSDLWDFYYCPTCRHWFQSSAQNASVAIPVSRKAHERALTLLYAERMKQLESLYSTGDSIERLRRRVTLFMAKVYLKLSRLGS